MTQNLLLSISDAEMLRLKNAMKTSLESMQREGYEDEEIIAYAESYAGLRNGTCADKEDIKRIITK